MKRILIAEDDEALLRSLNGILLNAGYEVLTASNGATALEIYRRQPVELVITDLFMPGMDGLETIIELCQLCPGVRIIAISGGGGRVAGDYLPIARRLGAVESMAKPFTPDEILNRVATVIGTQRRPLTQITDEFESSEPW